MITKSRNINTSNLTRLKNRESFWNFNGITIDENLNSVIGIGEMDSSASDGCTGSEIDERLFGLGLSGGFGFAEFWFGGD